ncbi:hypothetical protein BDV96DRAFT_506327 [Lophiotrema nucula]|uniref:Zn(2)-C6 fungal-type domain-containing protein n=1 Tax=Lophiotrema nucula TaxID=690887 RepID=A0A6A5YJM4_9PLEO|nr:hypothetical protein BDV96DRAFT_506327 [Lophiotrema nucula]
MMPGTQKNACLSCRQRKLKCDRQRPCANCVGRSVECKQQLLPPPAVSRGAKRSLDESDPSTISSILSRLDHIEAYINRTNAVGGDGLVSTPIATALNTVKGGVPLRPSRSQALLGNSSRQGVSSDRESKFSRLSANDDFLRHALTHHLSISITGDCQLHRDLDSRHIRIPYIEETFRLYQVYCDYVGQFQHIIFEPHFRAMTEEVYYHISHVSKTTAPRGLALVLAVVAMATILQPLHGSLGAAIPVLKERLKVCAGYIRSSMDCLEQHRRRMDHTLENVQAMLVLQFLINHIEGFSPRFRALMTESIAISHSLGLHRIDTPDTKRVVLREEPDAAIQEIKRRVWWYLTAMDWMTSMAQGPNEAVYLIQPRHISTMIPRHINEDDLGNPRFEERPLSEPTTMSYSLHRLKLAEISRCIVDMAPQDPSNATHELVSALDSKIDTLVQGFPEFFQSQLAETDEVQDIDQRLSYIPLQRTILSVMVDMLRCKLHFPYLTGHQSKALHAFSRDAGVRAARHLLTTHRDMITTDVKHSADFMKIQGTVLHMFIGALIVATDLCCNQPQGEDRANQLSELSAAMRQLESIRQHSRIAAIFLEALTQLLVKHGLWPPEKNVSTTLSTETVLAPNLDSYGNGQMDIPDFDPCAFEELWATFVEQPAAVDLIDLS